MSCGRAACGVCVLLLSLSLTHTLSVHTHTHSLCVCVCTASGKSTLAAELRKHLGLPVLDCDQVFWGNGKPRYMRFAELLVAELEAHGGGRQGGWICDGSYDAALRTLGFSADIIVWVEPGPWARTTRVLRRTCAEIVRGNNAAMGPGTTAPERLFRVLYELLWDVDASIVHSAAGVNRHRPNIVQKLRQFERSCADQNRTREHLATLAARYRDGTRASQQGPTKKEKAAARAARAAAKGGGDERRKAAAPAAPAAVAEAAGGPAGGGPAAAHTGLVPAVLAARLTLKQFCKAVGGGLDTVWDTRDKKRVSIRELFGGLAEATLVWDLQAPTMQRETATARVADFLGVCPPARYERLHNSARQFPEATPDSLLAKAGRRLGPRAMVVLRGDDDVGAFGKLLVGLHNITMSQGKGK